MSERLFENPKKAVASLAAVVALAGCSIESSSKESERTNEKAAETIVGRYICEISEVKNIPSEGIRGNVAVTLDVKETAQAKSQMKAHKEQSDPVQWWSASIDTSAVLTSKNKRIVNPYVSMLHSPEENVVPKDEKIELNLYPQKTESINRINVAGTAIYLETTAIAGVTNKHFLRKTLCGVLRRVESGWQIDQDESKVPQKILKTGDNFSEIYEVY